jgi:Na+/H+-dicarboxylate symporter
MTEASDDFSAPPHEYAEPPLPPYGPGSGLLVRWHRAPLYLRILIALALGIVAGEALGTRAVALKPVSTLVLQLLRLLATPLIFIAVLNSLFRARVSGRTGARLAYLLLTNTVVAILIGLLVANVVRPGQWATLRPEGPPVAQKELQPLQDLLDKIPANLVDPFGKNEIISLILLALAFGIAMRKVRDRQEAAGRHAYRTVEELLDTAFDCVMVMLHWLFDLVPLAVFAVVASLVGRQGLASFLALGGFVVAVLLALALQALFYLVRMSLGSWVRPGRFLRGASDALVMAFSTASSAVTIPVTYQCMVEKIGVREESAGIGVMVGGTFNHDGTALYEAMAALFISQALGLHLGPLQQLMVVFMSVTASVGAAGIPEAGLVTMMAVFSAVHLPHEYIPLLLTVDWFLDRCRTANNVMGDMTVTCLLDGKHSKD